jgi:hypothetical protein
LAFGEALGWLPFAPIRLILTNATQTACRESRFPETMKG